MRCFENLVHPLRYAARLEAVQFRMRKLLSNCRDDLRIRCRFPAEVEQDG